MQYDDNTILFLKANVEDVKMVRMILLWFQICSDLKINCEKSELLGVNAEYSQCVELASVLGC